MYFSDRWLCALVVGHIIVIKLILIRMMFQLVDRLHLSVTAQHCCTKLNVLREIKIAINGLCTFLLLWHGHTQLLILELVPLAWRCFEIYKPSQITNRENVHKYVGFNVFEFCYQSILMCVYITYTVCAKPPLKDVTVDWLSFLCSTDTLLYLYAIGLTHVMVLFLAYYVLPLIDIEFRTDFGPALLFCAKLYNLLPGKILVHAALTSALLACGYWISFAVNLPVLAWEIIELARTEIEGRWAAYDAPRGRVDIAKVNKQRTQCHLHLRFFLFMFYLSTISMMGESHPPLVIPLLLRYQIIAVGEAALLIVPAVSYILLTALKNYRDEVNIESYCKWLNALFCINVVLHMHLCYFMLVHGHCFIFLLNLFFLYFEATELMNREYPVYGLNDLRSNDEIEKLKWICKCYFMVYFIFFAHNILCVYIINAEQQDVLTVAYIKLLSLRLTEIVKVIALDIAHTILHEMEWVYSYLPFIR